MDPGIREILTDKELQQNTVSEEAEIQDPERLRALALAYARYLKEMNLKPGEGTDSTDSEEGRENREQPEAAEKQETGEVAETREEADVPETPEPQTSSERVAGRDEADEDEATGDKRRRLRSVNHLLTSSVAPEPSAEELEKISRRLEKTASARHRDAVTVFDLMLDSVCDAMTGTGRALMKWFSSFFISYGHSRKVFGIWLFIILITASVLLGIFNRFTAYEYAYNGKVLGYVRHQEDVTGILDIAGRRMSDNSTSEVNIEFVANENVTFNLVDARGRVIDDTDSAVNKFIYMTDIEIEAFAVFDGDSLCAVVKSEKEADKLLRQTKKTLSKPDKGMETVSAEFVNELSVRPLNVLLTSIQSRRAARKQMINGGELQIRHIMESNETLHSVAKTFGVSPENVFTEDNRGTAVDAETGDTVCIHVTTQPVSVKMVESGTLKEIIEYKTVKKETDELYKGDTQVIQEGIDGVRIFKGTITKIGGEITKREKTAPTEVLTKKQNKIILVGTAERPKTAATGTFIFPLDNYEGLTSKFGYRWGRLHSGIDIGARGGEPIHAADGGKVIYAGWWYGGGNTIAVEHLNGTYTKYEHCSKILVSVGDEVYQGQTIGLVGNTGNSFGNHLHLEVHPNGGAAVDPRPYFNF